MGVCNAFLLDCVAFSLLKTPVQMGGLRLLLEQDSYLLPRMGVSNYIPKIFEMGTIMIKKELEEAVALSMIFDATPHVGEVLAIVFRFLNPNNSITHRLGALRMYKYGFTGAQLAESIVDILLEEYKIPRSKVRTGTMDGCAVNGCAMDLIRPVYSHLLDLICVSHGANVIGKIMIRKDNCPLPRVKRFESKWSQLMNCSPRARTLFQMYTGRSVCRSSEIRWFCWFEIIDQVFDNFNHVCEIINDPDDFATELRESLGELVAQGVVEDLRMEMAMAKGMQSSPYL